MSQHSRRAVAGRGRAPPGGRVPPLSETDTRALFDAVTLMRPWDEAMGEITGDVSTVSCLLCITGDKEWPGACGPLCRTPSKAPLTKTAVKPAGFKAAAAAALRVTHMRETLSAINFALEQTLRLRAEAYLILDRAGAITQMGGNAHDVLQCADGLIVSKAGLRTQRHGEDQALRSLIDQTLTRTAQEGTSVGADMIVSRHDHGPPQMLNAFAIPSLHRHFTLYSFALLLVINDLARTNIASEGATRQVFGLSERETALTVAFCTTDTLAAAAAQAGMAKNTARNHLRSIFAKTGVHSQRALIQLLSRLPSR